MRDGQAGLGHPPWRGWGGANRVHIGVITGNEVIDYIIGNVWNTLNYRNCMEHTIL